MNSNSNSSFNVEGSVSETTSDTAQLVNTEEASTSNYGQLNNHGDFQVTIRLLHSLFCSSTSFESFIGVNKLKLMVLFQIPKMLLILKP